MTPEEMSKKLKIPKGSRQWFEDKVRALIERKVSFAIPPHLGPYTTSFDVEKIFEIATQFYGMELATLVIIGDGYYGARGKALTLVVRKLDGEILYWTCNGTAKLDEDYLLEAAMHIKEKS